MKNTKICPKCQSPDVLRVEGHVGGYGAGNNIMLGKSIFSAIALPRYVCCRCGYAEEWVDSNDLYQLQEKLEKKRKERG